MITATVIDATDGWLARRARVKETLPGFDGAALDNLVDFHTYATLPLLPLWRASVLPGGLAWLLLVPLLASAYGFSQTHAKTDDGFFLGFPSYWNVVAFYLYVLEPPVWAAVALISVCSTLTFVPTVYVYPSRGGPFSRALNAGAAIWCLMLAAVLLRAVPDTRELAIASLAYPALYLSASAIASVRRSAACRDRS
jgi:phosphatidylcholine synthase